MRLIKPCGVLPGQAWRVDFGKLSRAACCVLLATLLLGRQAWAHDPALHPTQILDAIGFDQRLDAQVPLDLSLRDENGRTVRLGDYFTGKPVLLNLGYWECPNLCPLSRAGLLASLVELDFTVGQEFAVLMVSIDPTETPALATTTKTQYLAGYQRAGSEAGWHFLGGDHEAIDRLAEAIGFRYAYDAEQDEYAHVSGLVVLTPTGKAARYLYGIDYNPRDLRLSLVEATDNRIGKLADQVLLFCYSYNPVTGRYSLLLTRILQTAAAITVVFVVGLVWLLLRNERQPLSPQGS